MTISFRRLSLLLCAVLIGVSTSVVALPKHSSAATPEKGGITVSPAVVNLSVSSTQLEAKTVITVTNNYASPIRLSAEWQAIDEVTGRLIPSGPLDSNLSKSLSISETDLSLASKASKQISIAVRNSEDLAPGGHYATLVFSELSTNSQTLGLKSALSVTVFIVKRDGAKPGLKLDEFKASHNLFQLPSKANLTLTNSGNVHAVPRAAITIEHNGDIVAKGVANASSLPLLPGKKSSFTIQITKVSNVYWPSRLQLRVVYRGDQGPEPQEIVSSFWYMPPLWPLFMLVIIVGLFFLARTGLKKFKKRRRRDRRPKPDKPQSSPEPRASSQINISAVEITPSHNVPVSRSASSKEASKPRKIKVTSDKPKKSSKK